MRDTLLFGAGQRGQRFYKLYSKKYNIVGFLDNNPHLHGTYISGLQVFSPNLILQEFYGDVIITSDYYVDIYEQLRRDFQIDDKKIKLDKEEKLSFFNWAAWCRYHLPMFLSFLENYIPFLSSLFTVVLNRLNIYSIPSELRKLVFLYQLEPLKVLRHSSSEQHVGPKWLNNKGLRKVKMVPPVGLYCFTKAKFSTVGRCFQQENGSLVIEVVENYSGKGDYRAGFLRAHSNQIAVFRTAEPELITSGILISCFAPSNYYHWMVELLPQLQYVNELADLAHLPIFISSSIKKIPAMKLTLEKSIAQDRKIIYLDDKKLYQSERFYIISLPNNLVPNLYLERFSVDCSYFRSESLAYVRTLSSSLAQNDTYNSAMGKRLFLGRRGILRRYNQVEIFKLLEPYGFELIFIEDYTFLQQVNIFQHAEYVVGPTGASWVGLLFMTHGSKALCWMASEYGDLACYAQLAYFSGVELTYISYDTEAKKQSDLYFKRYTLDTLPVIEWLSRQNFGVDC